MIKTSLLFVYFTLSHIYISWYLKKNQINTNVSMDINVIYILKATYKHLKINDFLLIFPIWID